MKLFSLNSMKYFLKKNKRDILDLVYPIGRGFIDFTDTDYSNYLGFTWERELVGLTPIGYKSDDTDFNTIGKTGGSKTHVHDLNNATANIRNWQGKIVFSQKVSAESWTEQFSTNQMLVESGDSNSYGVGLSGNTDASSSLQPYKVVAYWKRVK